MDQHNNSSFINVFALLLFALVIAVVSSVTTYFFLNSRSDKQYSVSQSSVVSPSQTYVQPTSTPSQQTQTGFIDGSLSFPSERIPPQEVCAESIKTQQKYCTSTNIENDKYQYGKGYRLEVPEGDYYVFATSGGPDYKAYYSEFVTCGFSVNCSSHQSIIVKVFSGKTTSNIDPQDWYKLPE